MTSLIFPLRRPAPSALPALLTLLTLLCAAARSADAIAFEDLSAAVGIDHSMGRVKKYGGPAIADLNSDGHPDLLFCHHDKAKIEVYINTGTGAFIKHRWFHFHDYHGINPFRPVSFSKHMRFTMSPGGGNGLNPNTPRMYEYRFDNNSIIDVTAASGIATSSGRGRSAVIMDLKLHQRFRPDIIFTNAGINPGAGPQQFGFKNRGRGKFAPKSLIGYDNINNHYAAAADIDGDGNMELLSFTDFSIFKLVAPFTFKDISADVLPPGLNYRGAVSVAELDFDGDGDMDIYVARTNSGGLDWLPSGIYDDYLLENRDGVFVEVGLEAGIPRNTESRGVTVADFNNDGHIDIFLSIYQSSDLMLINNGDGTFNQVGGYIPRPSDVRGDMAQAVDYDSDGRVDLVVSQGDRNLIPYGGYYRVFRNVMSLTNRRKYILVRVRNAPGRGATSMHALVTVTGQGLLALRRVGSQGTAVSNSYIELLHFGIDWRTSVDVKVRWTNGKVLVVNDVQQNTMIVVGDE